jgi:hypothetical protein
MSPPPDIDGAVEELLSRIPPDKFARIAPRLLKSLLPEKFPEKCPDGLVVRNSDGTELAYIVPPDHPIVAEGVAASPAT